MQLIFNEHVAREMADRYLVLELETFQFNNDKGTVFCAITAESIPLGQLETLEEAKRLHNHFIENLKNKNYDACRQSLEHLYGKFGGELNSFYKSIEERFLTTE